MIDIKLLRENPEKVKQGIKNKGAKVNTDKILELDKDIRHITQETESARAEQNKISKLRELNKEQIDKAKTLKEKIKNNESKLEERKKEFKELFLQIPNLPLDDVPVGKDESENVVIKEMGKKPNFGFLPKNYLDLAEKLDIIDVKRAAKVSGTRFGYLKSGAVYLEFALIQLAFNELVKQGFYPIVPPVMIKTEMMKGMGYMERGGDEIYQLPKDNLVLVGTSEQSIGPMHADEIFDERELPKRYVAFSSCFRREAGSYGKDTKGIFRVHQFYKVEMFSFCHPDKSKQEHQFFLKMEEKLMQILKIPYRIVQVCTGDLAAPSASTYDLEAWLPSENRYRETHSTSNCTDFQARRLNIRYKGKKGLNFVHTLNGTAFATGRMIIAILENYQQKDGSILIPKALQKYTKMKEI
ncbi:MAG: serine--tRNA ligase [Patescibacteria group bacterium]